MGAAGPGNWSMYTADYRIIAECVQYVYAQIIFKYVLENLVQTIIPK